MTVEDVKQNTKMQNGTDELKRKKSKRAKKKTAAERKNRAKTCFLTELGGHCLLQSVPCLVGDYVCAITGDSIRVYSVYTSDFVASLTGHTDTVTSIIPHPTQPLSIISSSLDGTVRIWSVDDFALLRTIQLASENGVNGVKATENDLHLIINGSYARIPVPDLSNSERVAKINPTIIVEDVLNDRINENGSVDRQWSLNAKGKRIAFLTCARFMKIYNVVTKNWRRVSFASFKDGEADKLDYHPREESIMVSFSSGKNVVFSNLLEGKPSSTTYHWHQGRDDAAEQGKSQQATIFFTEMAKSLPLR